MFRKDVTASQLTLMSFAVFSVPGVAANIKIIFAETFAS